MWEIPAPLEGIYVLGPHRIVNEKGKGEINEADSPGALWSEIWLVNLERIIRNPLTMDRLTQALNLDIRLKASVNLLVSLSTCGADRLDAPKLLRSKAKKRFNTWKKNRI